MKNKQRGFMVPLLIIVASIIVGGVWFIYSKNKAGQNSSKVVVTTSPSETTTQVSTPSSSVIPNVPKQETVVSKKVIGTTYKNSTYGYSFIYPTTWKQYDKDQISPKF